MSEPTLIDPPVGLRWVKLVCRLGRLVTDSEADENAYPDILPVGGKLTLAASPSRVRVQEADGRWRSIEIAGRTYTIRVDGELVDNQGRVGVYIPDPASLLVEPQGYAITAVVKPTAGTEWSVTVGGDAVLPDVVDLVAVSSVGSVSPSVTASFDARIYSLEQGGGGGGSGLPGEDGASAYEVAVANGFVGTEAQWLTSLVGPEGDPGEKGAKGDKGDPGDPGDPGDKGPPGDPGPAPETSWVGTSLVVDNHPPVDLKGAKGDKGDKGDTGNPGTPGTTTWAGITDKPSIPDSPDDIGAAPATQPINAKTASYTLVASDAGKLVTVNSASATTITVPNGVFSAGQRVDILDLGNGRVTFVAGSGMTLNGTPTLVSRARYSAHSVVFLSASQAVVVGDLA